MTVPEELSPGRFCFGWRDWPTCDALIMVGEMPATVIGMETAPI